MATLAHLRLVPPLPAPGVPEPRDPATKTAQGLTDMGVSPDMVFRLCPAQADRAALYAAMVRLSLAGPGCAAILEAARR